MKTHIPIQDCKLRIYSFVDSDKCERVTTFLGGFKPEWNDTVLTVLDWKIADNTGRLTYQINDDLYAPVFDQDFPVIVERYALKPPGRSKNWKWNSFSDYWINSRTGERVKVY